MCSRGRKQRRLPCFPVNLPSWVRICRGGVVRDCWLGEVVCTGIDPAGGASGGVQAVVSDVDVGGEPPWAGNWGGFEWGKDLWWREGGMRCRCHFVSGEVSQKGVGVRGGDLGSGEARGGEPPLSGVRPQSVPLWVGDPPDEPSRGGRECVNSVKRCVFRELGPAATGDVASSTGGEGDLPVGVGDPWGCGCCGAPIVGGRAC